MSLAQLSSSLFWYILGFARSGSLWGWNHPIPPVEISWLRPSRNWDKFLLHSGNFTLCLYFVSDYPWHIVFTILIWLKITFWPRSANNHSHFFMIVHKNFKSFILYSDRVPAWCKTSNSIISFKVINLFYGSLHQKCLKKCALSFGTKNVIRQHFLLTD